MNWLFFAVAAFLIFHVIDGFRRGFVRKFVSAITLVLTLVLVIALTPMVTSVIQEHTSLQQSLQEKCSEMLQTETFDENVKSDQVMMIDRMNLPDSVKRMLHENNNSEVYKLLEVANFHEYVGAYLAKLIISAMSFLLTFLLVWTLLKIILIAMDLIAKLPLLHGINQLAGGALGLVEGVFLVWVVFLLVAAFCNGEVGQKFYAMINESQMLTYLYEKNVLMNIVFGLIL